VVRVDVDGLGKGAVNGHAIWIATDPGWRVAYLHLAVPPALRVGAHVTRGQVIGLSGATGRSTGPHLHLQIFGANRTWDPRAIYPGGLLG